MAPITPHLSEEVYENLVKNLDADAAESVHMDDWMYDESLIDKELEAKMDNVRDVIEASARARDVARYKLRWPVSDITVVSQDEGILESVSYLEDAFGRTRFDVVSLVQVLADNLVDMHYVGIHGAAHLLQQ